MTEGAPPFLVLTDLLLWSYATSPSTEFTSSSSSSAIETTPLSA